MNAWLIYDRVGAEKNRDYIDYHLKLGEEYSISFEVMDSYPDFNTDSVPDFALVRTINPDINKALEDRAIPTFNSYKVSYIANHKGRCMDFISRNTSVPCIPTRIISGDSRLCPGNVIKPASGHGGKNVTRVGEDGIFPDELKEVLKTDDVICQPFIEGPGEDVRVYVIGKRIVAAVRRRAEGDEFRANASLGGATEKYILNDEETEYVNQIISLFDFGMVGIDFIIDNEGRFIFNEIEDVVGARMLYKTHPEIDILREYLEYITKVI